jgi:predicted transcriptional regulator
MKRGRKEKLPTPEKHEMRRYREAGVSLTRLAGMYGVSRTTICKALRELAQKMGPEKLPPEKKHLARRHIFTSGNLPDSTSSR